VLYRSQNGHLHELWYRPGSGQASDQRLTEKLEGLHTGEIRTLGQVYSLQLADPGSELRLEATVWARGRAAENQLSTGVITLTRSELLLLIGRSTQRVLPLITGHGGEYAVTVTISVEGGT
jgi:hypothetical protein